MAACRIRVPVSRVIIAGFSSGARSAEVQVTPTHARSDEWPAPHVQKGLVTAIQRKPARVDHGLLTTTTVIEIQRAAGNAATTQFLATDQRSLQRAENKGTPEDRSRQSKPRNCPTGTRPIDESGLDRETIHGIKDAIGAGPRDWVGITPGGNVVTGDGDGNAQDHGHVSDFCHNGAESVPKWVWGLLEVAAVIALIVLFATGVGELGTILAGAGEGVVLAVRAALLAAGVVLADNSPDSANAEEQATSPV
jgi:hypothetical protein